MRITQTKLLGGLAALMPSVALAEAAWPIYTPAAGGAIYQLLTGVAAMLERGGAGSIVGAVLVVALLGFIGNVTRAGLEGNFPRVLTFILSLWVSLITTFNIKVPVMIIDRVNPMNDNVVSDVPIIFAGPASLISEVGNQMAEKADTWLSMPDGMSMRNGGQFNLFAKVLADSSTYKITDPGLRQSVTNYVNDCTIPAMARGQISLADIQSSKDLWATLKYNHPGLMTRLRLDSTMVTGIGKTATTSGTGDAGATTTVAESMKAAGAGESLVSCADAHGIIGGVLNTYVAEFGKGGGGLNDLAASGAVGGIAGALSSATSWIVGDGFEGATSGTSVLQQRIMVNSINGTFRQAAAQTGNSPLLQAAATTQAEEAQKSTWVASASIFNDLMGYIFIILQATVYALAPFALLMLFTPGAGLRGAITYLQMLLWIALWEPLLVVVNYMVALFGKSSLSGYMAGGGFDMTNAVAITEASNNLMMAAGFMGTMVPMIAWKIASGSMGLMEFVQGAGGSALATQAGSTASTGNLSLGNVGLNSRSMNKDDFVRGTELGTKGVNSYETPFGGGLRTSIGGGTAATLNGSNAQVQEKIEAGKTDSSGTTIAHEMSAASARAESLAKGVTDARAMTNASTSGTKYGTTSTSGTSSTFNEQENRAIAETAAITGTQAAAAAMSASIGGGFKAGGNWSFGGGGDEEDSGGKGGKGGKGPWGAGFSISGDVKNGYTLTDGLQKSTKLDANTSRSVAALQAMTGATTMSFSSEGGFTATLQNGTTYSLTAQEMKSFTETYSQKLTNQSGTSNTLARSSSMTLSGGANNPFDGVIQSSVAPQTYNPSDVRAHSGSPGAGAGDAVDGQGLVHQNVRAGGKGSGANLGPSSVPSGVHTSEERVRLNNAPGIINGTNPTENTRFKTRGTINEGHKKLNMPVHNNF